jgi:hypothetical protein
MTPFYVFLIFGGGYFIINLAVENAVKSAVKGVRDDLSAMNQSLETIAQACASLEERWGSVDEEEA